MSRDAFDEQLVRRYGSPLYVYELERIRAAARDLRAALPEDARLYYSVKANPHPRIVAETARLGLYAEVSSAGELAAVLAGGHRPERCMLTGPGKTRDDLIGAINAAVRLFSVESVADRDRLASIADELDVHVDYLVRLNGKAGSGGGLRMTGRSSQFGIGVEHVAELEKVFRPSRRARPVGGHVFAATNIEKPEALLAEFDRSAEILGTSLTTAGGPRTLADLGGGFAAPFALPGERPDYRGLRPSLEAILDARLPGWRRGEPSVAFEAGRHLVADCGSLLTTVLDVKHSRGTTYIVVDAGINALGGMSGLGRLLIPAAQPEIASDGRQAEDATLVGPLCTPLDVLGRSVNLPPPAVGDVLRIPNVGAYGLTCSLIGFLSRQAPRELVLEADGEIVDARRAELRYVEGVA